MAIDALKEMEIEEIEALQCWDAEDGEEEPKERFKVDSLDSANWCLRKLSALAAKSAEVNALANNEMARIREWQEGELKKFDRNRAFLSSLLEAYHREVYTQDPKAKTISTPYGKMQIRKSPPKWNYDMDTDSLLNWLKANRPDLVRVIEEPNKQLLKKVAKVADGRVIDPDTGAIIEGVTVEEQPERFSVEVS